jgi:DNA-binding transcriptional ArsR family regulator
MLADAREESGADAEDRDARHPPVTSANYGRQPPPLLAALIGYQRAAILDRLDQPARAGKIAEALVIRPGATTYHLRNLEAAGLVTRTRCGPYVIVERTERGNALVALYELPSPDERA